MTATLCTEAAQRYREQNKALYAEGLTFPFGHPRRKELAKEMEEALWQAELWDERAILALLFDRGP